MAKLLIAEDEEDVRVILEKLLMRIGGKKFEIESVRNGAEAVERLVQNEIDVFLTDLIMPGLDGLEVIRRVREFSSVPIVVISGSLDSGISDKSLAAGANKFFAKPPDFYKLASTIFKLATIKPKPVASGEVGEMYRRLARLKEQAARQGFDTPPNVLNEIEDIEMKIAYRDTNA